MSWVMDPLPSFQIYKSTSLMFLHFVIPDAVLQCHNDATDTTIANECAKYLKYGPDRSGGVVRTITRPDNVLNH